MEEVEPVTLKKDFIYLKPMNEREAIKLYKKSKRRNGIVYIAFPRIQGGTAFPFPINFLKNAKTLFESREDMFNALGRAFYRYFGYSQAKHHLIEDSYIVSLFNKNTEIPTRWAVVDGPIDYEFQAVDLPAIANPYRDYDIQKEYDKAVVYVMIDHNTGMHKIGKSKKPWFREKTLQSEKPSIEMIRIFKDVDEKQLHNMFAHKRVRGEWFELDENDLFELTNFAKMSGAGYS